MAALLPYAQPEPSSAVGKALCASGVLGMFVFLLCAPAVVLVSEPAGRGKKMLEMDVLRLWMMALTVFGCAL